MVGNKNIVVYYSPLRRIHFFKAESYIGFNNKLTYRDKINTAVKYGGEAVLSDAFLARFPSAKISSFKFPKPQELNNKTFLTKLTKSITEFKEFLLHNVSNNEIQVVIGGDHCISLPSVLAVLERLKDKDKLGYIHFDSHGDMNLYVSSPSKNFHGMYLRPLFDVFDMPQINELIPHKLSLKQLLAIGDLELDIEEKDFFLKNHISNINRQNLLKDKENAYHKIRSFASSFSHVHISFDVDIFNRSIVSATTTPSENGFMPNDVFPIIQILSKHPSFTLDIAEINPRKPNAEKTISIAQEILQKTLTTLP